MRPPHPSMHQVPGNGDLPHESESNSSNNGGPLLSLADSDERQNVPGGPMPPPPFVGVPPPYGPPPTQPPPTQQGMPPNPFQQPPPQQGMPAPPQVMGNPPPGAQFMQPPPMGFPPPVPPMMTAPPPGMPPGMYNLPPPNQQVPPGGFLPGTHQMTAPPQTQQQQQQQHQPAQHQHALNPRDEIWVEHKAPDGKVYYYNMQTRETSWDRPENVTIIKHGDSEKPATAAVVSAAPTTTTTYQAPPTSIAAKPQPTIQANPVPVKPPEVAVWNEYKSGEGRSYYHNSQTNQTTWDKPQVLIDWESKLSPCTLILIYWLT